MTKSSLCIAFSLTVMPAVQSQLTFNFTVEEPPPGDIVTATPVDNQGPASTVYFPANCYIWPDGPNAGLYSKTYSCEGSIASSDMFESPDCTGPSTTNGLQNPYTNFACTEAPANVTYISMYDDMSADRCLSCTTTVLVTSAVDDCRVAGARGYAKFTYTDDTIQATSYGPDAECSAMVAQWSGVSGSCAQMIPSGSAPIDCAGAGAGSSSTSTSTSTSAASGADSGSNSGSDTSAVSSSGAGRGSTRFFPMVATMVLMPRAMMLIAVSELI